MGSSYHPLTPRPIPSLLSLIIPLYNEQEMLPVLRPAMTTFIDSLEIPTEVILVNDGSSDRTADPLLEWASADRRIKVLCLARNFGHQAAVTAGLDSARGDAVVILDADLQDPLDVIPQMISCYCEGYDVVYGQRIGREGESAFKRLTAWLFYRLMKWLVHPDLPVDTGDFRLISRPCLTALRSMRETHRFLRGMVAWVGFPQIAVQYRRSPRAAGSTKYPLSKMLRFAWTAAVSFSPLPLRISLMLGFLTALFGVLYIAYTFSLFLVGIETERGWATIVVLLCLIGGAILMSIGVLGEYVGRIFEESKDRPLYIVSFRANVDPDEVSPT